MSGTAQRLPTVTKTGVVSSMWEMDEDARRLAFIKRASLGASKALRSGRRDVLIVEDTPAPTLLPIHAPEGATTWKRILFEVAIKHNVPAILIMGRQRTRYIVAARHEVYYRLAQETIMSMAGVGRKMGRDHTSVLSGIKAHLRRAAAQAEVKP